MAQQAKKQTDNKVSPASELMDNTMKTLREAEKKVLDAERQGLDTLMHAANDVNRVTAECAGMCSDNLVACMESGNTASRIFQDISNELMESTNHAFSDTLNYSQELLTCRTFIDIIQLQSNAMQQNIDRYFEETEKLWKLMFDGINQAMEPFHERTAIATEQVKKMLAV